LPVTGGTYNRTYTNSGTGPTGEADPATVSGFRLDKYLVTVGRFRKFVNGGAGYVPAAGAGKHTHLNGGQGLANSGAGGGFEPGWVAEDNGNVAPTNANLACDPSYATWTSVAGTQENLPINCVNWYEATAFCIWDGGFLPSEAEWEYAAAGGSQEREYPWGSTAPGTGNQYAIYGCDYPSGSGSCTGVANIAPVGSATLGAGLWGHLDLAGEVSAWNVDWYASYASCTDCADTTTAFNRVVRGSYFLDLASLMLPPDRVNIYPPDRDGGLGFRCARTP
jgi:sulfatase modifying factor 1